MPKTRSAPVGKRSHSNRKLRSIDEAARNVVPPVSSTIKSRRRRKTQARVEGRHERTALRRLVKKKFALITLDNIDRRSHAFQKFSSVVRGVTNDLGGAERLTTVERALIEAFGAATVRMEDLAARQLLGDQKTEYSELASAISSMVRIAKRLGTDKRPKEITPLSSYLNGGKDETIDGEVLSD